MKPVYLAFLVILLTLSSCYDTTTNVAGEPPIDTNNEFVISGTIVNPNNHPIPDDARLVLIWGSNEDESRIWGEGTIDKANNTFTMTLDPNAKPYYRCLLQNNNSDLGIAFICMVNKDTPDVIDPKTISERVIAFVAYRSVIFKSGNDKDFENISFFKDFIHKFSKGYTTAKPLFMDEGKDQWAPGESNGLLLEFTQDIGEPKNNMPNWS